jgi:transcriptional regulator with XRE-family HTH domain
MNSSLRKIGAHIRELRHQTGISQEELADRAGLHRTYIGAIERGERNVGLINLFRIARALKVKLAELFADLD